MEFCRKHSEGRLDSTSELIEDVKAPKSRLSDLAEFTRIYAESNKSQKTLEREQWVFKRLIKVLGDIQLSELTAAKIEEFKSIRLKEVAVPSINIEIRVLGTAFNQAFALNWITEPPKQIFKQLRLPESEPPAWLNHDQIDTLLGTSGSEFRQFLQFLLYTGCRRNEALGVQWTDVNLEGRQIVVRSEIGKMGKRRTIPISDELAGVLKSWVLPSSGKLFPNYHPNQVSMKFRRLARQILLPKGISLHSLRATFACHLIKNGVDIYTVSRLLGHSSVKVTEKHYLALDPKHLHTAVSSLTYGEPTKE